MEPTRTPAEQISRQKLLTRCRNLLLDNGFFSVLNIWGSDLAKISGIGKKGARLIESVINGTDEREITYLFPYPDGIDQPIPYNLADEVPLSDEIPDELEDPLVPVSLFFTTITGMHKYGPAWAEGYMMGLLDSAYGMPGLASQTLTHLNQSEPQTIRVQIPLGGLLDEQEASDIARSIVERMNEGLNGLTRNC